MKRYCLDGKRAGEIAAAIPGVSVCVVGDLCLDLYWHADMRRSRLSRETPHFPLPIVKETCTPGAGGNVVQNILALGVKRLFPVSVVGDDWRGRLLLDWMEKHGVDCSGIVQSGSRVTPAYCKPIRHGISPVTYEDPRLDFENFEAIDGETEQRLLAALEKAAAQADVIAVCDQFDFGVVTGKVRECLARWAEKKPVVADSRENLRLYQGMILKPNEVEAAAALGEPPGRSMDAEGCVRAAEALQKRNGAPVIVTLGEQGAAWCGGDDAWFVPTRKAEGEVDPVGAGDTFLSAFCCAFAAGAKGWEALGFANAASGVTVKKIGTTGTASPAEILEKVKENTIHGETACDHPS